MLIETKLPATTRHISVRQSPGKACAEGSYMKPGGDDHGGTHSKIQQIHLAGGRGLLERHRRGFLQLSCQPGHSLTRQADGSALSLAICAVFGKTGMPELF